MRKHISGHSRPRTITLSLAIALFTALVGPGAASAAWTAPAGLSATGLDARGPSVGIDANGNAAFAWVDTDNDLIQAGSRTAAGVLGAVQDLSAAGQPASDSEIATAPNGDSVVSWVRSDGTNDIAEARTVSASGALGPVHTLSAAGHDAVDPQVAIDANGNAVFTWRRFDGTDDVIEARTLSAAGALGATLRLSLVGEDGLLPRVAMNAAGAAAFTWFRDDGANARVRARALSAAGVLSGVRTLSAAGQDAFRPDVAMDPVGNAVFTWYRFDGTVYRIQARAVSAGGVASTVQTLSDAGEFAYSPRVEADASGDAVFTWYRQDGVNWRVQARTVSATGVPGAVLTLSDAGEDGLFPQLGLSPAGDAVFTWVRSDGSNDRVQARTLSAAGVLGPVATLSDAGQDAASPRVAVDPAGAAVAAWYRFDGADWRVEASAGP